MTGPPERSAAMEAFLALPVGSRVVVRYRIGGGGVERPLLTDALGFLVRISNSDCCVRTREGDVTVNFADIVAAKQVPPAPVRRSLRSP